MVRRWDHDKTLPRGDAPGTRGGRPVRLQSGRASRDTGVERPPRLDPPPDALIVVRPRMSLFHPKQWMAVTAEGFEARDGENVEVLRRHEVQAIALGERITFVGAGERVLGTTAPVYTRSQIERVANALGVRVIVP
jgi:hypothetical protein